MERGWLYAGIAISALVFIYFVWRPVLVNQTKQPGSDRIIVGEFAFCHQLFERRVIFHSRLIPIRKDATIIDHREKISTDRKSCIQREGTLFGFLLPRRGVYYDDGP